MNITLLIQTTPEVPDDNYPRIAARLMELGHRVQICLIDRLSMHAGEIRAEGFIAERAPVPGTLFTDLSHKSLRIDREDLIWILALGFRTSFLDKIQLLNTLMNPVINSINAILYLKSKYQLSVLPEGLNHPETHASTSWRELYEIIRKEEGDWIAKPPAGSFGRDIFKLNARDTNLKSILQSLTGTLEDQFCLIQRYLPAISQGEKRILFGGGRVIGQYLRIAVEDHRTNLSQGSHALVCGLTPEETVLCANIGRYLVDAGAYFVALDLVYPHIIEFNVINPGGLVTLQHLTGLDHSGTLVDAVLEHF